MDWLASGSEVSLEEDDVDASHLPEGSTVNTEAAAEELSTRIA